MGQTIELTGTTDGAGALTVSSDSLIEGYVETIVNDYSNADTGADYVITCENGTGTQAIITKANLGTADSTLYPRTLGNKVADGSAYTDSQSRIYAKGKMKLVVAAGGATKTVRVLVYINEV